MTRFYVDALLVATGLFWTITYVLIIRRGALDKTYGMPMVALFSNIAWEFIFSFVSPHRLPQLYINWCWFLLDVIIFTQFMWYGRKEFTLNRSVYLFAGTALFGVLAWVLMIYFAIDELDDRNGKYMAFVGNLVISLTYLNLLKNRENAEGQSIYIALAKLAGTGCASLLFFLKNPGSPIMNLIFVTILVLDILYVLLLYRQVEKLAVNPWGRI